MSSCRCCFSNQIVVIVSRVARSVCLDRGCGGARLSFPSSLMIGLLAGHLLPLDETRELHADADLSNIHPFHLCLSCLFSSHTHTACSCLPSPDVAGRQHKRKGARFIKGRSNRDEKKKEKASPHTYMSLHQPISFPFLCCICCLLAAAVCVYSCRSLVPLVLSHHYQLPTRTNAPRRTHL